MKKKGFTLIELLAVIVILAVIALIATPVIMNSIEKAKGGAIKDAAYGCIDAVEYFIVRSMEDDDATNDYPLTGPFIKDASNISELNIKGTNPLNLDLVISNNQVISGTITFNDYSAQITDGKVVSVSKIN